jgi:hypothetical protein
VARTDGRVKAAVPALKQRQVERRLAAIVVVDYNRVLGADEEGTLAQFKATAVVDPETRNPVARS